MSAVIDPTRHRFSIDDFERLGAAGILAEDSRVELIEGDLIDMIPLGIGHMVLCNRLNRLLVLRAGDAAIVSVGHPLRLPPWSMPQPDFMLLRPRADEYASAHPGAGDLLLAIEVADTKLRYDRVTKARVYASHGVAEYWIVDVEGRRLLLHRDPREGAYASVEILSSPLVVAPAALPALALRADDLWPPTPAG